MERPFATAWAGESSLAPVPTAVYGLIQLLDGEGLSRKTYPGPFFVSYRLTQILAPSGNVNDAGMTPTIVTGRSSTVIDRPTTPASLSNR